MDMIPYNDVVSIIQAKINTLKIKKEIFGFSIDKCRQSLYNKFNSVYRFSYKELEMLCELLGLANTIPSYDSAVENITSRIKLWVLDPEETIKNATGITTATYKNRWYGHAPWRYEELYKLNEYLDQNNFF